jgi:hypothetical protein
MPNPTPLSWINRLPLQTQLSIQGAAAAAAAGGDPSLALFLTKLSAAQEIDVNDAQTQAGVTAMFAAGLLNETERDALLDAIEPDPVPARTVVASSYIAGHRQADNTFYVTELFEISDGSIVNNIYRAEDSIDLDDHLAARAASVNGELAGG